MAPTRLDGRDLVTSTSSQAAIIFGDPGPVNDQFAFRTIDITSDFITAFGSTVSGQSVLLDFVFADNKRLEPSDGFQVGLQVNHDSVGANIAPTITQIAISDELGQITRSSDLTLIPQGSSQFIPIGQFEPVASEVFYDAHFDVTFPDYGTSPDIDITQVLVSFGAFDGEEFTIGQLATVPEPTSVAVWSLIGLCGVGYRVRRRVTKEA